MVPHSNRLLHAAIICCTQQSVAPRSNCRPFHPAIGCSTQHLVVPHSIWLLHCAIGCPTQQSVVHTATVSNHLFHTAIDCSTQPPVVPHSSRSFHTAIICSAKSWVACCLRQSVCLYVMEQMQSVHYMRYIRATQQPTDAIRTPYAMHWGDQMQSVQDMRYIRPAGTR